MRYVFYLSFALSYSLFGAKFDLDDEKKLAVLRHFDIPASFLQDPYLHDVYDAKKREVMLEGFAESSENAEIFVPMLSSIIAQSDLPSEFLFVALVESRLVTTSSSSKGASGIWQFMPRTGKLHGLEIDQYVDERRDHVKSTRAAIAYLSSLHKQFGKWYLALIAYNCGDGRLSKAIRKAKTTDLNVLADPKKAYIPPESRRYIRKVVALAFLGTEEAFLSQLQYDDNATLENPIATVYLPEGEEIDRIAAVLEMPQKNLKKLNTHLKRGVTPPNQQYYPVYIPKEKLAAFQANFRPKEVKGYFLMHRVKSGETIANLSNRYNISPLLIIAENKLEGGNIAPGKSIRIPVNKALIKDVSWHRVKSGETLASVAALYNLTIKELKARNPFVRNRLKAGQKVKING